MPCHVRGLICAVRSALTRSREAVPSRKLPAIHLTRAGLNVCVEFSQFPVLRCIRFKQRAEPSLDELACAGIQAAFDLLGDAAFQFGSQVYVHAATLQPRSLAVIANGCHHFRAVRVAKLRLEARIAHRGGDRRLARSELWPRRLTIHRHECWINSVPAEPKCSIGDGGHDGRGTTGATFRAVAGAIIARGGGWPGSDKAI